MRKIGKFARLCMLILCVSVLGLIIPTRVAYADIAGGGAFAIGMALMGLLILGGIVAVVALISFLIIRAISKKNDSK